MMSNLNQAVLVRKEGVTTETVMERLDAAIKKHVTNKTPWA
jgi:hypothetical protein